MSAEQHWAYRVAKVRYGDEDFYDIREYYEMPYGPAWSADPMAPMGESIDDLIQALRWMLSAAEKAKASPELVMTLDENGDKA